ncbi:helicase-related protein [Porphyrobacter sp. GA68]|uniref:helicase-related protein n=1 Tax=Porphyrobacter sp. GA68 TaxID=2883480 RepID=UPI001D18B617|nr:helicase-related protein [Porphyrobacter sp. GA68]
MPETSDVNAAVSGMGAKVLRIMRSMGNGPVLYLCDDDAEAEGLAAVVAALLADAAVVHLPASDTLPGDDAPASPANVGHRVAALRRLRRLSCEGRLDDTIVVTTGEAAGRRYLAPEAFDAQPPGIGVGDPIDPDQFREEAVALGYFEDNRVDEPGEIAIRGEVIDLYPADAGGPVRIDLAEGQIAAIHQFDGVTQLRGEECKSVEIGRAVEPDGDASATLLDHMTPGTLLLSPKAEHRRARFVQLAGRAAKDAGSSLDAVDDARWQAASERWRCEGDVARVGPESIPRFAEARSPARAARRFLEAERAAGRSIALAGSRRDLRFLRSRLGDTFAVVEDCESLRAVAEQGKEGIVFLCAPLDRGARDTSVTLVAAADILGTRALLDPGPSAARQVGLAGVDLRLGDLVIHENHGFASVVGLEPEPGAETGEVIALEYADGARRLVPVSDAGLLWRYGGDAESVKRDKLDGTGWDNRRAKIDQAIAETATSLIALAEERAKLSAPAMNPDAAAYERFVSGFPHNETSDQARAIAEVRDDLASGKPMERLVIGDVGYGKTEVALRAAAIAALSGYQVIVAAPTTVLARQHLEEFTRRFADTGIAVAGLSRLTSAAEKKAVMAGLADGSVGIVVGTAAVVGKSVRYARLGLVIIDEEQRFGAADKARLRQAADVHLLVMSATPIPRTLHRAMIGLQQVSVIATPPARRQPIRTIISDIDDPAISLALRREKMRKGQSFVVVPRIADLAEMRERLERLAPDLSLVEVHGKMPAAELDEAMVRFAGGTGDILLATNIIETGLDVPRANTMVIWRSDRFGLAQLHQLRGRVGRGRRRGQVILTTADETVSLATQKRLRTLETFDQLGSGFSIAGADLDQRGGGDILSDAQAGHMKLIGAELYQHLLAGALRRARGEAQQEWHPEIRTGTTGAFPSDWIPEDEVRLNLYIRLARLRERAELEAFEAELVDRFGPLPDPAQSLIDRAVLTILALETGIRSVNAGPKAIALTPATADGEALQAAGLVASDDRWLMSPEEPFAEPARAAIAVLETLADG